MAAKSSRKAQGVSAKRQTSGFDVLYPELVDYIVEKAARTTPLKRLGRVNKTFREAARRCSRTLVLSPMLQRVETRTWKRPRAEQLWEALREEISLRPNLCSLVLTGGEMVSCLWVKVLSQAQWTSVQVRCEDTLDVLLRRLSASRLSLKKLELDLSSGGTAGAAFDVNTDLKRILQAFPNLEDLKLRGDWSAPRDAKNQRMETIEQNTRLTSLELSNFKLPSCSQVFRSLSFLKALRSLQLTSCEFDGSLALSSASPSFLPTLQALQTLQIEVFDEALVESRFLPNLAEHFPNLQHLLLRTIPVYAQGRPVGELAPQITELQKKCPQLERIVISRSEMLFETRFSELFVQSDLLPKDLVDKLGGFVNRQKKNASKFLVLEDSAPAGRELWRGSCSVTLFRFVILFPFEERRIPGDRKRLRTRLLGNAAAIDSWCNAFV